MPPQVAEDWYESVVRTVLEVAPEPRWYMFMRTMYPSFLLDDLAPFKHWPRLVLSHSTCPPLSSSPSSLEKPRSVAGVSARLDRFLERGPVLDLAREMKRIIFVISALTRSHADPRRGSRTWERGPSPPKGCTTELGQSEYPN